MAEIETAEIEKCLYSNSALKGQKNVYVIHFQLVTDRFSQTTEIEIEIEINNFT